MALVTAQAGCMRFSNTGIIYPQTPYAFDRLVGMVGELTPRPSKRGNTCRSRIASFSRSRRERIVLNGDRRCIDDMKARLNAVLRRRMGTTFDTQRQAGRCVSLRSVLPLIRSRSRSRDVDGDSLHAPVARPHKRTLILLADNPLTNLSPTSTAAC